MIDVGPAGKGVPDGAADTGSRTAERFDFGGVVVGFVFEHEEPRLYFTVHIHVHLYGAGVNFAGFLQVGQGSGMFQILCADGGYVHQGYGIVLQAQLQAHIQIGLKRSADVTVLDGDGFNPG